MCLLDVLLPGAERVGAVPFSSAWFVGEAAILFGGDLCLLFIEEFVGAVPSAATCFFGIAAALFGVYQGVV